MSHFTTIKTKIVEKEYLQRALTDLGYTYEEGKVQVRGYQGNRTEVEVKITTNSPGYDIGLRKTGDSYEVIADWWGIKNMTSQKFLQPLNQRYAYHAAKAKLEAQGFSLVSEQQEEGEKIHLVLRRMV
ncbi:MAG: DUF1257 domain-containing protein [Prochloron sp. SP5CPC1]|nr:DUF1257 domain-containing protein [Candidatus Paraprochloron terpiosi SP5CPC1]